eukprot:8437230-Pyramimonas_sp.AAC.1
MLDRLPEGASAPPGPRHQRLPCRRACSTLPRLLRESPSMALGDLVRLGGHDCVGCNLLWRERE